MEKRNNSTLLEKIVSLCKRRGFVYQGSELYGGLSGTYDYGPFGVLLKENVKRLWWRRFVDRRDDLFVIDTAILMNRKVWEASGHSKGFADPLTECRVCRRRFRADADDGVSRCPECGGALGPVRPFNMMFKTYVGVTEDPDATAFLRPETAQGMFVNFKNIVDTFHPPLPFGIAQIGKAFRNEIAPRDFLFRTREFEQMEIEYFVKPSLWREAFELFLKEMHAFADDVGIDRARLHDLEVPKEARAHYSARTVDIEFEYPFGRKELWGLAHRTDFDLRQHAASSGVPLSYLDEETGEPFIPHVVEPSLGVDRTVLAILLSVYEEDEMNGEKRTVLRLKPSVAPIKAAVFPLLRNKKKLVEKAREIHQVLKREFGVIVFDDNGNIGKRYRRQDEIGTPLCVTVDFETLEKNDVTVRDRDSGKQERVFVPELPEHLRSRLA